MKKIDLPPTTYQTAAPFVDFVIADAKKKKAKRKGKDQDEGLDEEKTEMGKKSKGISEDKDQPVKGEYGDSKK